MLIKFENDFDVLMHLTKTLKNLEYIMREENLKSDLEILFFSSLKIAI